MFKLKTLISEAFVLALSTVPVLAQDDPWFFTASEIASAYRYQLQFGPRLGHPLEPQSCFNGEKEFAATYQGRRFIAPCRFIGETVRQTRELLESGAAKYLFALDVDHGDLAVPAEVYASKFRHLPRGEILPALLGEPSLVAIYQTAVHLDSQARNQGSALGLWGKKLTFIGFYDGRPNQAMPRLQDGGGDSALEGLVRLGSFNMVGHFLGELALMAGESVVTFDLSFDDDRAAPPIADMITAHTAAR